MEKVLCQQMDKTTTVHMFGVGGFPNNKHIVYTHVAGIRLSAEQ